MLPPHANGLVAFFPFGIRPLLIVSPSLTYTDTLFAVEMQNAHQHNLCDISQITQEKFYNDNLGVQRALKSGHRKLETAHTNLR